MDSLFFRKPVFIIPSMKTFRPALILVAATALGGCDRGISDCEEATQAAFPAQSNYQKITTQEDPGETPAMTYYVIDYFVTAPSGQRLREQVHCSYMRDTSEAIPHRVLSTPVD